jgi:hypothetical protein
MVVPLEFLVIAETSTFQDGIGKETHSNLTLNIQIDIVPTRQQQKPRQIPLYSKAKWDNVISDVKAIYNEIMNMKNIGESVNSMWTYFQTNLDNSIKNNIPH